MGELEIDAMLKTLNAYWEFYSLDYKLIQFKEN